MWLPTLAERCHMTGTPRPAHEQPAPDEDHFAVRHLTGQPHCADIHQGLQVSQLHSDQAGPFDLAVGPGECVAIVGKSGSGKSLFLRLVADLDAGVGSVRLDGRSRDDFTGHAWRERVIYQAAEAAWWAPKVRDHFPTPRLERCSELLEALHLSSSLLDSDVSRLSTGERQRLALVRSLAAEPTLLLLDEPTASLDQASVADVEGLLQRRLLQGMALILVTHAREQASRLASRIYEMQDRKLRPI